MPTFASRVGLFEALPYCTYSVQSAADCRPCLRLSCCAPRSRPPQPPEPRNRSDQQGTPTKPESIIAGLSYVGFHLALKMISGVLHGKMDEVDSSLANTSSASVGTQPSSSNMTLITGHILPHGASCPFDPGLDALCSAPMQHVIENWMVPLRLCFMTYCDRTLPSVAPWARPLDVRSGLDQVWRDWLDASGPDPRGLSLKATQRMLEDWGAQEIDVELMQVRGRRAQGDIQMPGLQGARKLQAARRILVLTLMGGWKCLCDVR